MSPQELHYKNPIIRGFNPDPCLCRVGEDYYLATSSFEYAPGCPIYHSSDLANWEHITYAFPQPKNLSFDGRITHDGVWAPTLRYIKGRFYVIATISHQDVWPACHGNYFVSAPSIHGPWTEPVFVTDGGIDPDLFEDNDGTVYYMQNPGAKMAPIDLESGQLTEPLAEVWSGSGDAYPEAPHLYRIGDYYYIMLAEGGTGPGHCATIARSKSIRGPYESCPHNPILSNRGGPLVFQSMGHADLVETPDGHWFAVCLGVRDHDGISVLGRETFLMSVRWENGWPIFGENGRVLAPDGLHPEPMNPVHLVDDFENFQQPLYWNTRLGWGEKTIERGRGRLQLTPNGRTLDEDSELAWIGLRQPDFNAHCEISLDVESLAEGQNAGLCVYVRPEFYLTLGLIKEDGKVHVVSRLRAGHTRAVLAQADAPAATGQIRLAITAKPDTYPKADMGAYILSCANEGEELQEVTRSEMNLFGGTATGTGYTGAFFACYAEGTQSPVLFSNFELQSPKQ